MMIRYLAARKCPVKLSVHNLNCCLTVSYLKCQRNVDNLYATQFLPQEKGQESEVEGGVEAFQVDYFSGSTTVPPHSLIQSTSENGDGG